LFFDAFTPTMTCSGLRMEWKNGKRAKEVGAIKATRLGQTQQLPADDRWEEACLTAVNLLAIHQSL
jgi:hypothetical protein